MWITGWGLFEQPGPGETPEPLRTAGSFHQKRDPFSPRPPRVCLTQQASSWLTARDNQSSAAATFERPYKMPDENINRLLAARIVGGYLRRNQVAPDQLTSLIATVYDVLGRLGKPATEPVAERVPAVSIRRSVQQDRVTCIECGWAGSMLRRHLRTAHGLTPDEYRARWKLPADHAMTAPAYSERRSTMAKELGLGRGGRRALELAAPDSPAAPPRRRGRPRSAAKPA
jgi:predicted transcriptional regulator